MNRVLVKTDISNFDLQTSNLLVRYGAFFDSPSVAREYHVLHLLHVLSPLGHVQNHVEGLVNTPDSPSLLRLPSHRSESLSHLRLVPVLAQLALLDQVQHGVFERFDLDVDLVVLVRRLSFNRPRIFPHSLTIDHDRFGGNNLHPSLGDQRVRNLKVQRAHSRDQIFASFLVDARYEVRVLQ